MKSEERKRIFYLDFIRIMACMMVILQHAPMPGLGTSSVFLSATSFLTYPGIGLFFMVSGALLLPVRQPSEDFYKRRLTKVTIPAVLWMLFYLILGYALHKYSLSELVKSILLIPLMPSMVPVFWFIYVLIGLYLFAPVISPWLEKASKKEFKFYFILWGITLFIPILNGYLNITYGYYSILCYFGGYLGYFIMGFYLHHFNKNNSYSSILLLIGVPILVYALCKYCHMKENFNTYYYLSVFSVSMAIGWFLLLKKVFENMNLDGKLRNWTINLSNACFGIYLVHLFFIRNVLWNIDWLTSYGGIFQIVVTTILTLTFSYLTTFLLSKLPFSKYLIGY